MSNSLEYRQKNREKYNKWNREYEARNKTKIAQKNKIWRSKNVEKLRPFLLEIYQHKIEYDPLEKVFRYTEVEEIAS